MSLANELQAKVRSLGAAFNLDILTATQEIYRQHLDMTPVEEKANLVYGSDERQRLDLYLPKAAPLAVVVYVHGGGFVGGDKNGDGTFYLNVGRFLARHGFAAVLPNYRRAPAHGWPAGAEDVRDVIGWVRQNVRGLATDELDLFVLGQSAGASHVGSWLFDSQTRGTPLGALAGVMLMSGFYNAAAPLSANALAYFGDDVTLHAQRSPITHVSKIEVPVCLSVAELDPGSIGWQTFQLAEAMTRCNGRSPEFAWLRGHNHVSTVLSLGSPQQDAAAEILRFLKTHLTSSDAPVQPNPASSQTSDDLSPDLLS